jgi:hypothetical protein
VTVAVRRSELFRGSMSKSGGRLAARAGPPDSYVSCVSSEGVPAKAGRVGVSGWGKGSWGWEIKWEGRGTGTMGNCEA